MGESGGSRKHIAAGDIDQQGLLNSSDTMGWKKYRRGEALAKNRVLRLSMQEKADEEMEKCLNTAFVLRSFFSKTTLRIYEDERKGCFNPVWSLIRVNIQISTNVSQVTWLRKTFEALE
ncbi:hypothetical protein EJB05_35523, partial [Eragrostis curvula]